MTTLDPARLCERLVRFSVQRPGLTLTLWVVAVLGSVLLAAERLGVNTDTMALVSDTVPAVHAQRELERAFPALADNLFLVITADTPESADTAARRLAARLRRRPDLFRSIDYPAADPFFAHNALLYLDTTELAQLADDIAAVQPFLARLTADPTLRGLLDTLVLAIDAAGADATVALDPLLRAVDDTISAALDVRPGALSWEALMNPGAEDRRVAVVTARPIADYSQLFPIATATTAARAAAVAAGITARQGMGLAITGPLAIEQEDLASVMRGADIGAASSFVLVALILVLGLRSLRLTVVAMITLTAGLAVSTGFATLAVGHLNLISVAFAALYIGLGIDYAIHFLLRVRESATEREAIGATAIKTSRAVSPALLLCTATTSVAFFAFVPTPYTGVGELGLIAGAAAVFALLATLSLLPALLAVIGPLPARRRATVTRSRGQAYATRWRSWAVVALAAALGAAALSTLPRARFDRDPLQMSDPTNESVRAARDLAMLADQPILKATVVESGADQARTVRTALDRHQDVERTTTLFDLVPPTQDAKLAIIDEIGLLLGPLAGPAGASASIPPAAQLEALQRAIDALARAGGGGATWAGDAAMLAVRLETLDARLTGGAAADRDTLIADVEQRLLGNLPGALMRLTDSLEAEPFRLDDIPPRIASQWRSADDRWRIEVLPRHDLGDARALRAFVDAVTAVAPDATDEAVQVLRVGDALVATFWQAFLSALAVITLLLMAITRRMVDAVLVLMPLLYGALLISAAMVVFGLAFNYTNVIALPLLLGIGVDSGIHIVQRAREGDLATVGDLLRSSTARATVLSALTTIAGFGSLAFSAHRGTASLGQVLIIGLLVMMVATVVLLPVLVALRTARAMD